jgi:hypothetical protein
MIAIPIVQKRKTSSLLGGGNDRSPARATLERDSVLATCSLSHRLRPPERDRPPSRRDCLQFLSLAQYPPLLVLVMMRSAASSSWARKAKIGSPLMSAT